MTEYSHETVARALSPNHASLFGRFSGSIAIFQPILIRRRDLVIAVDDLDRSVTELRSEFFA